MLRRQAVNASYLVVLDDLEKVFKIICLHGHSIVIL